MGVFRSDPVCHLPGHGRYPKGQSCFKCRKLHNAKPEPVQLAVTEASLPTCGCGRKIRGGHCPNPGCP